MVAIQHGRAIYNMQASFHSDEVSIEHQIEMPKVPPPESIRPLREIVAESDSANEWFMQPRPIDQRYIGDVPWSG